MKKFLVALTCMLALAYTSSSANAVVLNFDDITNDSIADIYEGYGGLYGWQSEGINSLAVSKIGFSHYPGLVNGVTSGEYAAATNYSKSFFLITSPTLFKFNNAQFASVDLANNTISIKGYLNDALKFSDVFDVTNSAPTFYEGLNNFIGINRLEIGSTLNTSGDWIMMDDFNFTPVPEPSTLTLGLISLAGAFARRKKVA